MVSSPSIAVIGGGIVGLAVARELLRRRPGSAVVVLEKEAAVGRHQTGHNSGVLHSGVYYQPGSLRAHTCVAGAAMLGDFCRAHGVPVTACGKVIVATRASELPRLEELRRRGQANGVGGVSLIGPERLRELEPHVVGLAALHVPTAAVVDFTAVARALVGDIQAAGGEVRCGLEVTGIETSPGATLLVTAGESLSVDAAVICAGLQSDRLAGLAGAPSTPWIVPFRGDWLALRPDRAHLVRGLVYPVPQPGLPFLGVHATRGPDGRVLIGPNAVLALAREGYRRGAVDRRDLGDMLAHPGLWRLVARHWRSGAAELLRDRSRRLLLRSLHRYLPEVTASDLHPAGCGIRAQAVGADGRLIDDFVLWSRPRLVAVRNAPSPAATAALAIAGLVADEVERVALR
jgi:L-2-hydroxyglutarate oxidase LhgO